MSASKIPTVKLNDGHEIPVLAYGLGTARATRNGPRDASLIELTKKAIATGFLHLDGAQMYGNEEELGEAIRESNVPRSSLFVTTKYSSYSAPLPETFAASLAKLGLDYVDLYLIHHPFSGGSSGTERARYDPAKLQSAWADLEELQRQGKIRSIGVSNFIQEHLEAVLQTAKVKPAVNQVEFHPYLQHGTLLDFHKKHGITTEAYGPLTPITKNVEGPVVPIYKRLAEKYGVSESEVGLRWVIDSGVVAITTSSKEERLRNYIEKVPSFNLTDDEVKEIAEAGRQKHFRAFFLGRYAEDDRS
ncbi:hypothetical protein jhhlp_004340 [Lomentospora prolificans]|uniref:NADP-dependent oxidoreductase domain-containing protein n=1 Tax=Lomentospora prolificans TaxID=41688 RepID=A0A2N3NBA9_9PEZI|nr:hypothetical protein jhhlp_004340 [Lomentospora prolificans]